MATSKKQTHAEAATKALDERGLPSSPDSERFALSNIILGHSTVEQALAIIDTPDFMTVSNKRLFTVMKDLHERNSAINRITVSDELQRREWLEGIGGLAGLLALEEGMPEVAAFESYLKLIREKADLRALIFQSQSVINQCLIEAAPAQEIAAHLTESVSKIQVGQQVEKDGSTPQDILDAFPGGISSFLDPTLRKRGLSTRYRLLDDMLGGGLQDGELIILAARPGCGKSALALNIAQNITMHPRNPQRVDLFSLEMSAQALLTRMLCGVSRVDNSKFRAGFLSREERSALQHGLHAITEAPLRIHDEFKRTLTGLVGQIRRAVKNGSKLTIVDFVQLLVTGGRTENRNLELGEIGRTLKLTTLELGVPILLLSQIGRGAEKRTGGGNRPQLSDLKDSGTLEENADTVMTIFREELYSRDREEIRGQADLDILKQRSGECGRVPLTFVGKFIRFENRNENAFDDEQESLPDVTPPRSFTESQAEQEGW